MMAEATMAVVRDVHRSIDAMQVQVLEEEQDGQEPTTGKPPIYALGEFKWGAFRDVDDRIDKYWMWGALRGYAAYFFSAFKDLTWDCSCQLRYTLPCDGCNRCKSNNQIIIDNVPVANRRWWHAFLPRKSAAGKITTSPVYSFLIFLWYMRIYLDIK